MSIAYPGKAHYLTLPQGYVRSRELEGRPLAEVLAEFHEQCAANLRAQTYAATYHKPWWRIDHNVEEGRRCPWGHEQLRLMDDGTLGEWTENWDSSG